MWHGSSRREPRTCAGDDPGSDGISMACCLPQKVRRKEDHPRRGRGGGERVTGCASTSSRTSSTFSSVSSRPCSAAVAAAEAPARKRNSDMMTVSLGCQPRSGNRARCPALTADEAVASSPDVCWAALHGHAAATDCRTWGQPGVPGRAGEPGCAGFAVLLTAHTRCWRARCIAALRPRSWSLLCDCRGNGRRWYSSNIELNLGAEFGNIQHALGNITWGPGS